MSRFVMRDVSDDGAGRSLRPNGRALSAAWENRQVPTRLIGTPQTSGTV